MTDTSLTPLEPDPALPPLSLVWGRNDQGELVCNLKIGGLTTPTCAYLAIGAAIQLLLADELVRRNAILANLAIALDGIRDVLRQYDHSGVI